MLLELAVGDAYGAGFEYAPEWLVRSRNTLTSYVRHPTHRIAPGAYTDDTQMSLAIAEAIVEGVDWTPINLARKFVAAFKRDPRDGYARGFGGLLRSVKDGDELLDRLSGHNASDKSGGAMRAAPIGVFPSAKEVLTRAAIQARITHDTPQGVRAAQAAALMTHYFLYRKGPKAELAAYLEQHVPGVSWRKPWSGKVGAKGVDAVRAAVTAVQASSGLSSLLRRCIAYTGDVDTVATIALAAGSCCNPQEMAQDLPAGLVNTLEGGRYGKAYIADLDRRLMALVAR